MSVELITLYEPQHTMYPPWPRDHSDYKYVIGAGIYRVSREAAMRSCGEGLKPIEHRAVKILEPGGSVRYYFLKPAFPGDA